jgi:hypothetical protein
VIRVAVGGRKWIGSAALANKRGASAVKLGFTPAYTFWKQCDPRLPLQELQHTLAASSHSPSPSGLPLTGLYMFQKLSQTKGPCGAIMM